MKQLTLVGIAVAMFACNIAMAFPSFLGVEGGYLAPNADIVSSATISVSTIIGNDDEDFQAPVIAVQYPLSDSLQIGVGYEDSAFFMNEFMESAYFVTAKYQLPMQFLNGKLAVGAMYFTIPDYHFTSAYLTGTWPVFGSSELTTAVMYTDDEWYDEQKTSFLVNLEKKLKSGAALGIEADFAMPHVMNWSYEFGCADDQRNFVTLYATFPIDEQAQLRFGLEGLGFDSDKWNDVMPFAQASFAFGK